MTDDDLRQTFAELVASMEGALGLVVGALAQQCDPQRLANDLRRALSAAEALGMVPPLALRLATSALAAAEAEIALRKAPARH